MCHRIALLPVLALAGLACGNSREEKALDEAQAACFALTQPGTTLDDAAIALRGAPLALGPECTNLLPLPSNDSCAPATGDTRCAWYWYYPTNTVCSATGGCCGICEVRALRSDEAAHGGGAAVCGSAFYRRQPCP
jgi:hypothetical protein